jgi:3'-phosphoadenosine 5'-phosphosulfate sulfotransferase (PAPS reductase)/FAD synthetase
MVNEAVMNLHDYNLIIINSSAGKDSLCAIWEICRLADEQGYPREQIVVSHQDLGKMEWAGTKALAKQQADFFGLPIYYSKRITQHGEEETLLDYARRRGKWPSSKQRWCTSDFKRAPGAKVVTALTRGQRCQVLHVFGFRAEESPARAKREVLVENQRLTTRSRVVHDYLPIHDWTVAQVWETIRCYQLPYHWAYDLGMPRLSCVFCIFSPFDALVLAGQHNPELLEEYIQVEQEIGHTFRDGFSIAEVKEAIQRGYQPRVKDWIM